MFDVFNGKVKCYFFFSDYFGDMFVFRFNVWFGNGVIFVIVYYCDGN